MTIPTPPLLTSAERTHLISILACFGSDFDSERAAAGLLASRMLQERQLTWDQLLAGRVAQQDRQADARRPDAQGGRTSLDLCRRHQRHLSAWEKAFVAALARQHRPLTSGQTAKLTQIAAALCALGFT